MSGCLGKRSAAFRRSTPAATPSFNSAQFAHDCSQIAWLRILLEKPDGATIVHGATDDEHTAVVTAMARESGVMQDLDIHPPTWFVEPPGIRHCRDILPAQKLNAWVQSHWDVTKARQVLMNGLWNALSAELRPNLVAIAGERHLLVADDFQGDLRHLNLRQPCHGVQVAACTDGRIHLRIRVL